MSRSDLYIISSYVELANELAAVLSNTQVTSLDLIASWIGNERVKASFAALANTQVTSLDLRHNAIRAEGAKALAAFLANSQVTSLDL